MKLRRLAGVVLAVVVAGAASAADLEARTQKLIDDGLGFLKAKQQANGGWTTSDREPVAISALVLRAFAREPSIGANADFVARGYEHLLGFQLENGGIYQDLLANYNTAIAISSLAAAKKPEFQPRIDKALAYLRSLQWTAGTGPGPKGETIDGVNNPWYGGWGYGRSGRPDGSNLNIAIDALHDAGLKPGDSAYEAALKFVTRSQNLSETNDQPWAGNDGGFAYTPANKGESFAGEFTDEAGNRRLRSYGSMTYAGLKSFIYAGLTKDDPRVKAAFAWISSSFTVKENPGMRAGNPENARHGLYYYYHTLARAMYAYNQPLIETPSGPVDWREALVAELESVRQGDGSFVGDARWMEQNPILTTAFVVLALQDVRADLQRLPHGTIPATK